MTITARAAPLFLLACVALACPALHAGAPDRWVESRSANFRVVSNAGDDVARRVSTDFERVRAVLHRTLTNTRFDVRDPVVILAVRGEKSLRELLPQFWEGKGSRPVAAYWGGPHQHHIVLRMDAPDTERDRRVLHEYIHLLTHVNVPDLPAWLDEGLSELWGTAVVQHDAVEIGRPAPQHLKVLRAQRPWIPLDELLAMERPPDAHDSQRLSLFYAQSWALIHYAMLGGPSSALELAPPSYVKQLRQGAGPVEAGTLAFGDLDELETTLAAYVGAGRFRSLRMKIPGFDEGGGRLGPGGEQPGLRVRELPAAESLSVRAGFLVDGERPAAALPLLAEALRLNPREPAALEMRGCLHFQQNEPTEAAEWFDRAIESGAESHLPYFYRAILTGLVPGPAPGGDEGAADAGSDWPAWHEKGGEAVRAEHLLRRAIDLNPGFAPAYARLADLYAWDDGGLEVSLSLMLRATDLEGDNGGYWVALGEILLRLNRPGEAREAGRRGLESVRSARSRALIEAFLDELEPGVGR